MVIGLGFSTKEGNPHYIFSCFGTVLMCKKSVIMTEEHSTFLSNCPTCALKQKCLSKIFHESSYAKLSQPAITRRSGHSTGCMNK